MMMMSTHSGNHATLEHIFYIPIYNIYSGIEKQATEIYDEYIYYLTITIYQLSLN